MFACIIECHAKDSNRMQVSTTVANDLMPSPPEQGFVEFFVLSEKSKVEKLVCIAFSASPDVDEYHHDLGETLANMLMASLGIRSNAEDRND
jgi:hypothetical protein